MKVPVSVWLACLFLIAASAVSIWRDPVTWFQALGLVCFIASLIRVAYWLIEERTQ